MVCYLYTGHREEDVKWSLRPLRHQMKNVLTNIISSTIYERCLEIFNFLGSYIKWFSMCQFGWRSFQIEWMREVLDIWESSNKHPWNQSSLYFIMQQVIFLQLQTHPSFKTIDVVSIILMSPLSLEIITSNNLSTKIRCGWWRNGQ